MKALQLLAGVLVALGLCTAMAAAESLLSPGVEGFDCKMTNGVNNLIADQIIILRDVATHEIAVLDGRIYHLLKKPMIAEVKSDTPARLDIHWKLKIPLSNHGFGTNIYRLTFLKATRQVYVTVVLAGYDNTESSTGTCEPVK